LTVLKVGVTVAEGLLETRGRTLPSTSGLIGVVVVDAPTTLGNGADRWLLDTGFTWPTTATGAAPLLGAAGGAAGGTGAGVVLGGAGHKAETVFGVTVTAAVI
jgi:hypothetical protein